MIHFIVISFIILISALNLLYIKFILITVIIMLNFTMLNKLFEMYIITII